LNGYNTASAAASSASFVASLVEQAAAELRNGVVVVGINHLVKVDHSMNEAVEISKSCAAYSRSPKNPALGLFQNSSKSASDGS